MSVCFQILSIGTLQRKLAGKKAGHLKKPFDGGQCDGSLGRRKCKLINWNVVHVCKIMLQMNCLSISIVQRNQFGVQL